MKLTATEEYGLRCLIQVARRQQEGPVPIRVIADAEGLEEEVYTAAEEEPTALLCGGARGGAGDLHTRAQAMFSPEIEEVGCPLDPVRDRRLRKASTQKW